MRIQFIILLLISLLSFSCSSESSYFSKDKELNPDSLFTAILNKDLGDWKKATLPDSSINYSQLLQSKTESAWDGRLSDKNMRLGMHFHEVTKISSDAHHYLVKGKSNVFGNIANYEGNIELNSKFVSPDSSKIVLVGEYRLQESPDQPHPGVFSGLVKIQVLYNSETSASINFVGTFSPLNDSDSLVSIWGSRPFPLSKALEAQIESEKPDLSNSDWGPNNEDFKKGWWH